MERRITFFIEIATRTDDGWIVEGEAGLGALRIGDTFSWVHHPGAGVDEDGEFLVQRICRAGLQLASTAELVLRAGDILGGETADN